MFVYMSTNIVYFLRKRKPATAGSLHQM